MAKKANKLSGLRGMLADLVGQRDRIEARVVELELERDALDVTDAGAAVARLQDIGGELDASRRVLPALTAKIEGVQMQVAQEQTAEDKVVVERLWLAEREQMDQVVKLVGALDAALADVLETQAQIRRCRGFCKSNLAGLPSMLKRVQDSWRVVGSMHGEGSMHDRTPAPQVKVKLPFERWSLREQEMGRQEMGR